MNTTQHAERAALKLHEIIAANDSPGDAVEIQTLKRYKRSLKTWYGYARPVLMVTRIFNACQYAKIVDGDELEEAVTAYMDATGTEPEDRESERETILFNSVMFSQL